MKTKKRTTHILSGGCKDSYVSEVLRGIWKCLQLIVSLLIRLTQCIDALSDLYRPPMSKYTDIVDFVRVIISDHEHCTKCNIKSIPKAVRFIRFEVKPDSSYFEKCVEARECVKRLAKKCDDGEEKAWRSIQKMAQPNRTMGASVNVCVTPRQGLLRYRMPVGLWEYHRQMAETSGIIHSRAIPVNHFIDIFLRPIQEGRYGSSYGSSARLLIPSAS